MTARAGDSSVMAIVLTFRAQDALHACLEGLAAQTVGPSQVLVVDNAADPRTADTVVAIGIDARVLATDENLGPAGGHALGLQEFAASELRFAWIMDDDIIADPSCLERLLERTDTWGGTVFPAQFNLQGVPDDHPRWGGVLLPRAAVLAAGVPMAELFWWTEDTEYLAHRLPEAGFAPSRVAEARVDHREIRRTTRKPDWKIYYETRNTLYYRIRIQHARRAWKIFRYLGRVTYAIIRQGPPRAQRWRMLAKGIADGLVGRLGKRVDPEGR